MTNPMQAARLLVPAFLCVAALLAPPEGFAPHPLAEALLLLQAYLRHHAFSALLPALALAGALSALVDRSAIERVFRGAAGRTAAYGMASAGGAILAVCSCAVLPLFAGIRRLGGGLGPAITFLYAGPAINVLSASLTLSVLGLPLGLTRIGCALVCSVAIGGLMALAFRHSEAPPVAANAARVGSQPTVAGRRSPLQTACLLLSLIATLSALHLAVSGRLTLGIRCCPGGEIAETVSARVASRDGELVRLESSDGATRMIPASLLAEARGRPGGLSRARAAALAALCLAGFLLLARRHTTADERAHWRSETLYFADRVIPPLVAGIALTGLIMGRPHTDGLLPARWVGALVGPSPDALLGLLGHSGASPALVAVWPVWTNLAAALAGGLSYFASLTEVPIVAGLQGMGMGPGPSLALLLAGPTLSLPNLLVIRALLGTRRTLAYAGLVILTALVAGLAYGLVAPAP